MEVISPSRTVERMSVAPVIAGTMFGTLLMVAGIILAYVAYLTPFLTWLVPTGVLGPGEMVIGALIWSVALVAPAGFMLLGTSRLARILAAARRRIPRRTPLQVALASLPEDVALATGLTLPDGRGDLRRPGGSVRCRGDPRVAIGARDADPQRALGVADEPRLDSPREPARPRDP